MGMTKIDTSVVAEAMREKIRLDVDIMPGVRPRLVGFLCAFSAARGAAVARSVPAFVPSQRTRTRRRASTPSGRAARR